MISAPPVAQNRSMRSSANSSAYRFSANGSTASSALLIIAARSVCRGPTVYRIDGCLRPIIGSSGQSPGIRSHWFHRSESRLNSTGSAVTWCSSR